jgi:hypothetical protein
MKTFAVKQQEQVAQRPVFSGEEFKDTKGVIRIRKSYDTTWYFWIRSLEIPNGVNHTEALNWGRTDIILVPKNGQNTTQKTKN